MARAPPDFKRGSGSNLADDLPEDRGSTDLTLKTMGKKSRTGQLQPLLALVDGWQMVTATRATAEAEASGDE